MVRMVQKIYENALNEIITAERLIEKFARGYITKRSDNTMESWGNTGNNGQD